MDAPKPLTKQIVVKIDDELLHHLEADAAANERTISQSVRFLLRRGFAEADQ